jgi:hypothetical protein
VAAPLLPGTAMQQAWLLPGPGVWLRALPLHHTRTAQADELCRVCICAAMRQLLGEEESEIMREAEEALSAAWAPLLLRELQ